jgi:hypothetical protein
MSAYAAIESIVVAMLALASVFYVLKAFAPGLLRKLRLRIADWMSRPAHESPLNVLAARLRADGPSSGCATGCESGCNGCGIASRARSLPAHNDT